MRRWARWVTTAGGVLLLAGAGAGCGSSGDAGAHTSAGPDTSAGAGEQTATLTDTAAQTPVAHSCGEAAVQALEQVGRNVYDESAGGRIAQQAAYRLQDTPALAQAVAAGDAAAARQVLRGLLLNQIVSAQVSTRSGRTLAAVTRGTAGIAPVSGSLRLAGSTVGAFTVAVQGANGYAQTVSGLTGTQVLVRSGGHVLRSTLAPAGALVRALGPERPGATGTARAADTMRATGTAHAAHTTRAAGTARATDTTHAAGKASDAGAAATPGATARRALTFRGVRYRVDTFAGTAFPAGALSVTLLVPARSIAAVCASGQARSDVAAARADTWGRVAERVYQAEHAGSKAELLRGVVERSRAFDEAVIAGNARATRAAIVGFFRSHLHVVRVRVIRGGKLLVDVGGPHVLGPITGVVRGAHGRVVAHFEMAIQDDLGFTLLARTFTGAQSVLRVGGREAMGTLRPGPASIPSRGEVSYGGRRYEAYSFDGEAFPSGTLRISLLYPAA